MHLQRSFKKILKNQKNFSFLIIIVVVLILTITDQPWFTEEDPIQEYAQDSNTSEERVLGSTDSNEPWVVERIVDGDTIVISNGYEEQKVRLLGIDAPESKHPTKDDQCYGDKATTKLQQLIDGKKVTYTTDPTQNTHDRWGRLIAYISDTNGNDINATLIKEGFAREYTYEAPYIRQHEYRDAQENAQKEKRGLWGECPQP